MVGASREMLSLEPPPGTLPRMHPLGIKPLHTYSGPAALGPGLSKKHFSPSLRFLL